MVEVVQIVAGVRYSGSSGGQQVGIFKPSRTPPPFSLLDPWKLAAFFQGKDVVIEKDGFHVRGLLSLVEGSSRLIVELVDGPVLVRDWDLIKEVT